MRPIRFLTARLKEIPLWIKIPVLIMEFTALLILLSWVYLTRSVGTVKVPDLTGKHIKVAKADLRERNLNYRLIERSSMETPEGRILRQRPSAGSFVKENRGIDLFVSSGPEYVTVPDLRGRSILSARNHLYDQSEGGDQDLEPLLNLGNIARVHSNKISKEKIIHQTPRPGSKEIRGSRVDVLVSKGEWPTQTIVPDVVGRSLEDAKEILLDSELKTSEINYRYSEEEESSTILSQSPPPGLLVKSNSSVTLTANLSRDQTEIRERHTFLRITAPLDVEAGNLKVKLIDRKGSRVVYDKRTRPGQNVNVFVTVKGEAQVIIYWKGKLTQFRRMKSSEKTFSVNTIS